jgi:poly-D-alanine transfer protein DltD
LVEESAKAADDSAASSDTAQGVDSSQDVLKILASQNSNQSAINAAQLRLLALQNSNLQAIKVQLAVANQANANTANIVQGETQKRILQEQEKTVSNWRQNHTRYGRGS